MGYRTWIWNLAGRKFRVSKLQTDVHRHLFNGCYLKLPCCSDAQVTFVYRGEWHAQHFEEWLLLYFGVAKLSGVFPTSIPSCRPH
jgi:hypothetical protein